LKIFAVLSDLVATVICVRSSAVLAVTEDAVIYTVTCADDHHRWSSAEPPRARGLVLVRSGLFRVRGHGGETLAETTTGYLQHPDRDMQFAHPRGGDVCTSVSVSDDFWQANFAAAGAAEADAVPVDARVETAHLMLLRATAVGDPHYAVTERLLELIGGAVRADPRVRSHAGISTRLVRAAREAVLADDPEATTLTGLARHLGVSPYHLSRMFTAHMGTGLTQYRNRIRVSRALHRLHHGEDNLAQLALDLGFADQAHLTRTITSHVGQPPAALRRALTPDATHHRRTENGSLQRNCAYGPESYGMKLYC
jgi:AraC-like DNA-binding protein